MELWLRQGTRILAPTFWDYEIVNGLKKMWRQQVLTREEAFTGLERILKLNVRRYPPDDGLLLASLRWAERLGQGKAYDAQYVALADRQGAELWSADQRLVQALISEGVHWARWIGETTNLP